MLWPSLDLKLRNLCSSSSAEGYAQVAELVDAGDSKSPSVRSVGSSPTLGTKVLRL